MLKCEYYLLSLSSYYIFFCLFHISFIFIHSLYSVICQVHSSGKYISAVILSSQCLFYKPTFHSGHLSCNMPSQQWCNNLDIPSSIIKILLSDSVSYGRVLTSVSVYLITKTSAWGDRGYTTETLSISYSSFLYIRLVVIL